MSRPIAIHWFRQDLRLSDNPSLTDAACNGDVLPVYILDDTNSGVHKMGAASRWWLHQSLIALDHCLSNNLCVFKGNPEKVLTKLIKETGAQSVSWNRCYEPWRIRRDEKIKIALSKLGVKTKSFNGSLLREPWHVLKDDQTPYKVFTPFYKKGYKNPFLARLPIAKPVINYAPSCTRPSSIASLDLLPTIGWYSTLQNCWQPGETQAQKRLKIFVESELDGYDQGRNYPAQKQVSRLSPYLHFGEISASQMWYDVFSLVDSADRERWLTELVWREFSYYQLYHNPNLPTENLQSKFNAFPWANNSELLSRWQRGLTGIPFVDAGMRELWQTGTMHNRVRMVVASFLVKNLRIDWRKGAQWFWDCLLDADLASNSASWQWVAGCGTDAAPYFRIFNPVTQGEKFDTEGEYTRRFVPELKLLPKKYLFKPWAAPKNILEAAGIQLGVNYPMPIIDLKQSRALALEAFKNL